MKRLLGKLVHKEEAEKTMTDWNMNSGEKDLCSRSLYLYLCSDHHTFPFEVCSTRSVKSHRCWVTLVALNNSQIFTITMLLSSQRLNPGLVHQPVRTEEASGMKVKCPQESIMSPQRACKRWVPVP